MSIESTKKYQEYVKTFIESEDRNRKIIHGKHISSIICSLIGLTLVIFSNFTDWFGKKTCMIMGIVGVVLSLTLFSIVFDLYNMVLLDKDNEVYENVI